jgi:hypothetical protein
MWTRNDERTFRAKCRRLKELNSRSYDLARDISFLLDGNSRSAGREHMRWVTEHVAEFSEEAQRRALSDPL